jgi:hypothetical protein
MSYKSVEQRQNSLSICIKIPKVGLRGPHVSILRVDLHWESVIVVPGASHLSQMQAVLQKSDDKRCECQGGANCSEDDSYGVVQQPEISLVAEAAALLALIAGEIEWVAGCRLAQGPRPWSRRYWMGTGMSSLPGEIGQI